MLNNTQLEAIESNHNVTLVIAGAGSGKTTVLTNKVVKLVEEDFLNPESILAITFTNKATKEMRDRITSNLGPSAMLLSINTFHSFSVKLIRENLKYLPNHNHSFVIVDEDDKKKILKDIIKRNELDIKVNQAKFAISNAKAFAKNLDDVANLLEFDYLTIYVEYQKYLTENNGFDFDDLLLYAHKLLQIDEVSNRYKNRFKHILVDEYQDTSKIQAQMLYKLKGDDAKLFIVGDVDQSIYEWRGATIENIMSIEKQYEDTKLIILDQNYRSTKNILDCANNLIINNENRYDKNLWTDKHPGEKIKNYKFLNDQEEANFVASEVKYLEDFGTNLDEIAVLYRFNYQSRRIEEALIKKNVSYVIYGGIRYYERMEIKDVLAYLRLIINHDDNISFLRVYNVPKRKVGEVSFNNIRNYAEQNEISYFQAALDIGNTSLKKFCKTILEYSSLIEEDFKNNFMLFLENIGYKDYLIKLDSEAKAEDRMLNIEELIYSIVDSLKEGKTISEFLNDILIFTEKEDNQEHDAVVLSSVHGVKGLEFDNVFIIAMNEKLFPKASSVQNQDELEEERRVCYVAATRARKKLVLSSITTNFKGEFLETSRFVREMGIIEDEKIPTSFSIF